MLAWAWGDLAGVRYCTQRRARKQVLHNGSVCADTVEIIDPTEAVVDGL